MLSLGTEFFFAFWIASYSVGLPAGSPPPTRAATSMFLISLANSLPRRASITAFLCLVVAHLECPDMAEEFNSARSLSGAACHPQPEQRSAPRFVASCRAVEALQPLIRAGRPTRKWRPRLSVRARPWRSEVRARAGFRRDAGTSAPRP